LAIAVIKDPDISLKCYFSYFVGHKCELSAFGKGKAECCSRRQVLLGILINDEGCSFKGDLFAGNPAASGTEVKTLKANINACKSRFHIASIPCWHQPVIEIICTLPKLQVSNGYRKHLYGLKSAWLFKIHAN